MNFDDLLDADFKLLDDAVEDWGTLVTNLAKLKKQAEDGLHKAANKADWSGMNSQVTKEFIGKTAGEFTDAQTQSKTIHSILDDTRGELKGYQKQLKEAVRRGREKNIKVIGHEGSFTVTTDIPPEARAHADKDNQADINALRDDIQKILEKAAESDSSASKILKALADQTEMGFSDASYKNRDDAAAALKEAEDLARIAKKDPEDLTVKDFDRINAGLKKYKNDDLFSERFATTLGPQKTMEFWAGINNPGMAWDIGHDRRDQLDDMQRNLGLTLANASQSDSTAMDDWRRKVIDLGDKPIYGDKGGPMGFQVMSNLMRTGDYDDQFMKDYGTKLMATERKLTGNGEHANTAWQHLGPDPILNRIGEDSGSDPLTGYMKGLSNSPDAATEFFNQTYVSKNDPDNPFEWDSDDENTYKAKKELSNFQYLFEERQWPGETDSHGDEINTGKNNMALALEAATTGHPAGEQVTADTPAHSAGSARLMKDIVTSVSENPERLTKNSYMSDSMGQIAAEYMPDIHRGLHAGTSGEAQLFPIAGTPANLNDERDLTRFLYTVGRNPEGYAAVNLGQHSYTTHMMQHHFQHPDAYSPDKHYSAEEHLKQATGETARTAGTIEGILGAGRAYEGEIEGGAKDKEYNSALENASTWGGTAIGIGVGLATEPVTGPGGVIIGDAAGTAADEIIGKITEGAMKDSSGEVIYRNGEDIEGTADSTYKLVEEATQKAGSNTGDRHPMIESWVASQAEDGFTSSGKKVHDYMDGEGIPRQLDTED